MNVVVNGKIVNIFNGARVKDAVRRYSIKVYQEIGVGEKIIVDQYGNRLSLDGELSENQIIKIMGKN